MFRERLRTIEAHWLIKDSWNTRIFISTVIYLLWCIQITLKIRDLPYLKDNTSLISSQIRQDDTLTLQNPRQIWQEFQNQRMSYINRSILNRILNERRREISSGWLYIGLLLDRTPTLKRTTRTTVVHYYYYYCKINNGIKVRIKQK